MKWVLAFTAMLLGPLAISAVLLGFLAQPWAPFWIGERGPRPPIVVSSDGHPATDLGLLPLAPDLGPHPLVSDRDRYLLARAAGFSHDEALTATAISIAENGGGDPAALSGANRNGTRDLGLWQINSAWWPQFGGQAALTNPATNAHAAHVIYGLQGWCAWSTYDARCGPGHTGSYAHYLQRAGSAALP